MKVTVDEQPARATEDIDDYTPDAKERNGKFQHLVKYCMDLYDRINHSEYRASKIHEIKESYAAYEQKEEKTDDPWPGASNVVLPLVTISADNLEPRITAGLIGKRPFVRFEMESEQQAPEDVKLVESFFNNELEETVKIEGVGQSISHTLLLEGTCYPIAGYDTEERKIRDFATIEDAQQVPELMQGLQPTPQMDPATGQPLVDSMTGQAMLQNPRYADLNGVLVDQMTGEPIIIEKTEPLFEGGKVEFAAFKDIFILDDAEDWEKSPVIRRVYPTYAELMRHKHAGTQGYIKENIGAWLCREASSGTMDESQQSPAQEAVGVEVSKEVIPCLECTISYIYRPEEDTEEKEITDFTEERVVCLIAEDKKILLRICLLRDLNWKNEHLIKRIRLFPERGRAYGTTIFGKCKAIQKGASKTFNMALNIAEIVLLPWFFYSKRAGLKYSGKLKPATGVECDDPSLVVFPRFSINPDQMFQYLSFWEGYWERLLSIGDLQVGRPSKDSTATEVMAVIEEGNTKHNYQVSTTKREVLSLFVTEYDLYYQNMPLTKTFLYNGQQVPIPRAAMRRPFRFKLTGATEFSNKLIERKEAEDFFTLTTKDPSPVWNPISIREDLCRTYNRTDTARYINPQIAQIVATITQLPETAALFEQAVAQAQEMASAAQAQAQGTAEEVLNK